MAEKTKEQLAMNSYMSYAAYVKQALDRDSFTEKEQSKLCQMYITGVPVEQAVIKMKEKK